MLFRLFRFSRFYHAFTVGYEGSRKVISVNQSCIRGLGFNGFGCWCL